MSAADVTPERIEVVRGLIRHELPNTARTIVLETFDAICAELDRLSAQGVRSRANSRTAPPHPDTVEVDEEYLTDLEDSVRQLMGEKMEIEWDLSPMPERIKQARALRSAQPQPATEREW